MISCITRMPDARRYNKEGEPGRKVTCQECHQQKVGDQPAADDVEEKPNALLTKTIQKKQRKVAPKVSVAKHSAAQCVGALVCFVADA